MSAADLGQHGIEHLRDELQLGLGQLGHSLDLLLKAGPRLPLPDLPAATRAARGTGCPISSSSDNVSSHATVGSIEAGMRARPTS